ncbi:DUF1963 domain-containing protein [Marimonas lutisalis]|uniref:DUF1963 domain-containing protein n=1 Tax=Marimonas lutisalis TaxID=2545756 RepID=UPI0010F8ED00|nr:DUF1963 domain-containing protein [Marimonas lutisalis]
MIAIRAEQSWTKPLLRLLGLAIFFNGFIAGEFVFTFFGMLIFASAQLTGSNAGSADRVTAAVSRSRALANLDAEDMQHAGMVPAGAGFADATADQPAPVETTHAFLADAGGTGAEIAEIPSEASFDPTVDHTPLQAEAVRLRPVVPLNRHTDVHSWLGGLPHLPSDIEWPVLDNKPALFLAQISCSHLPAGLWGGRGPHQGWLAIFMSQERQGRLAVVHSERFGPERQPPAKLVYPRPRLSRSDLIADITGKPSLMPRWPIDIRPVDPDEDARLERRFKYTRPDNRGALLESELDLSDPRFHPFDWVSAQLLVAVIRTDLDWQHQVLATLSDANDKNPKTHAFLLSLEETRTHLAELSSELQRAEGLGLELDQEILSLMLSGLESLTLESYEVAADGTQVPVMRSVLEHDQILHSYFRWLDRYARQVYAAAPDNLPQPQRRMFEELWAWHAIHERGTMGGPIPARFRDAADTGSALLLRLQSSELIGWTFGDTDDLGIFIAPDALSSGEFRACFGRVSG